MEKRYLLIQAEADGHPLSWLGADELEDIAQLMEDYGVKRFLDDAPESADPDHWEQGDALLLEVRVLRVRPKTVVTSWVVE